MRTAVEFLAGALVAAVVWPALRPAFDKPIFARRNYRDVDVPVAAGLVIALAALAVGSVSIVFDAVRSRQLLSNLAFIGGGGLDPMVVPNLTMLVLLIVFAFGLLGLFDDLGAAGDDRGFRGHLGALRERRLTTGLVKLVFGGLAAVVAAAAVDLLDPVRILMDAPLIALAANLGNLFDRAPGRSIKVALMAGIPLLVVGSSLSSVASGMGVHAVAIVLGAGLGLLRFDLREELMLGDTGSNVLGAVVGLGVVIVAPPVIRLVVVVLLLALNLASEKVSFSKVIDRVAPLRFVDRLGRRPTDEPPAAPS